MDVGAQRLFGLHPSQSETSVEPRTSKKGMSEHEFERLHSPKTAQSHPLSVLSKKNQTLQGPSRSVISPKSSDLRSPRDPSKGVGDGPRPRPSRGTAKASRSSTEPVSVAPARPTTASTCVHADPGGEAGPRRGRKWWTSNRSKRQSVV